MGGVQIRLTGQGALCNLPRIMDYQSHRQIIEQWPRTKDFAEDVDVSYERAKSWRHRSSIPDYAWRRVIAAAQRRGIDGVTWEALAGIKEQERFRQGVAA
jgi:hypothetical protein